MAMEAFMDTPTVNGAIYPYMEVEPQAYRFRILSVANDRFFNLQMYVADPGVVTSDGRVNTEVKMVPAVITPGFPELWPTDGRPEGVPDPATVGPSFIQIGTEGGFLPAPAVIDNQPVAWNLNPTTFNMGNVENYALLLGPAERADVIVDFSAYAGKTLILYNDAPAAFPARDPRYDYFTGSDDQTSGGGAPTTQPGYGPNTRTIMQIRVANMAAAPAYDLAALNAAWAKTPEKRGVFESSQDTIIVPQAAYNSAYDMSFPDDTYGRIMDNGLTFQTMSGTTLTIPFEMKAIQDEMGEAFDTDYGRMSGMLGLELPMLGGGVQNFMLYGFPSPPVDVVAVSLTAGEPIAGDGTQIWKITHNGVDTHTLHTHLYNMQVINRVAWDNAVFPPDANELGWKETLRVDPLEDTIVAIRPVSPTQPFEVPNSVRPIDPTLPLGVELTGPPGGFQDPAANPVTVINHLVNYGWEYVMHCHLLGHEEMDMMHGVVVAVPPYAPQGLGGSLSGAIVNLSWTDGSISETGYIVQRSTASSPWATIAEIASPLETTGPTTGTLMYYDDTVVADGTVYSYRVLANKVVGDTAVYATSVGFPTLSVNSTPSNVVVVDTGSGIVTVLAAPAAAPQAAPPVALSQTIPDIAVPNALPQVNAQAIGVAAVYSVHAPIRIDSNADFDAAHGVSSGDGSALSPWMIQDMSIDGTGYGYGIYIGNTTDHFIVSDNYLSNASGGLFQWKYSPDSGLVLNNVTNGIVMDNVMISNSWAGIYSYESQGVVIMDNTVSKNYMGIYLDSSNGNALSGNSISENHAGVWLVGSGANAISNNSIARNYPGLFMVSSNGNIINNNSIYANAYFAVWIHGSSGNRIYDNDFNDNNGATSVHSSLHVQAYDDGTSDFWNATSRGNHWSDWIAPDVDSDGIVDVPYQIDGGTVAKDNYPVVLAFKPQLLATIVVTPSPVSVILNSTQAFAAQGFSQYGVPMSGLTFTWSSSVGTMVGSSLTAQAAVGTVGFVRATSGVVSGDAVVSVILGTLTYVNVTPSAVGVVSGGLHLFSAYGTDAYFNVLSGLIFDWTTTVGTITNYGLFSAQTTSGVVGYVNASVGAVTGSSLVTILFAPTNHIVVSPGSASVAAGTVQSFTAVGYDMYGNVITGLTFSWATTVGTMAGPDLTAQTTAGVMGIVSATSGFLTGYAFVTIVPTTLDHIDVAPATLSAVAGSHTLFTAIGRDAYDNAIGGLTFAWTSTIGTVDGTGLFTAPSTDGLSGYVNASYGLVIGSASVSVVVLNTPPILIPLVNVTTDAGEVITVTGIAVDADLDTIRYTWDFGDGTPMVVGQSTTHAYAAPGDYTLVLYADDLTGIAGHNVSSSATVTVRIVIYDGTAFVHGIVFIDRYTPGIMGEMDADESGLGSWEISLKGRTSGGSIVGLTTYSNNFDAVGYYEFQSVEPGIYWVNSTLLQGFYATTPIQNQIGVPSGLVDPLEITRDYGVLAQSPDIEFPFLLQQGWNLWSSPTVVDNLTAKTLLSAIGSSGLIVVKHDAAANKYVSYVVGDPDRYDFPVVMGEGYYVWAQSLVHFTLAGVMPSTSSTPLENGWNLVGYSGLETIKASQLLNMVQNSTGYIVVAMNPITGKYQSFVLGDTAEYDFDVTPGTAYYVWSYGSGTISYG
jgi:parallel beta-helix repeat protein